MAIFRKRTWEPSAIVATGLKMMETNLKSPKQSSPLGVLMATRPGMEVMKNEAPKGGPEIRP